jgi:AbiJ N-terminal domain 4
MENFSKRKGIEKTLASLQKKGMNDDLKNSLWNILYIFIIEGLELLKHRPRNSEINWFFNSLFLHFTKKPIDEIPDSPNRKLNFLKELFFNLEWNRVYDFFEWLSSHIKNSYHLKGKHKKFVDLLNSYLSRELAGYRLIDDKFVDITDE